MYTCGKLKGNTTNTVDPDETAHYEPSHLDLPFLLINLVVFGAVQVRVLLKFYNELYNYGHFMLLVNSEIKSIITSTRR